MKTPRHFVLTIAAVLAISAGARAQDPASSADRPPGNINELNLASLRPGKSTLADAEARFGKGWFHPSEHQRQTYIWCDGAANLRMHLETAEIGTILVVTVSEETKAATETCSAHFKASALATGRGVQLGDAAPRLLGVYGNPFFDGPSSWNGADVRLVVFNFAWAGTGSPQILESSFAQTGKLVKMTLSADYY